MAEKAEVSNHTRGAAPVSAARTFALKAMRFIPALAGETVEIAFVGEKRIRDLNREYRGKDKATDVLSFTLREPGGLPEGSFGSIVICPKVSEAYAKKQGMPNREMYEELILHGLLHITGSDHETDADHRAMERRRKRILEKLKGK